MQYENKTILITGASSGIGAALALALGPHRNRLVLTARRGAKLEELRKSIEASGSEVLNLPGDACDAAHADRVVEETVRRFGGVDIAVLNVGNGPASNSLTASRETILGIMDLNYRTLINFYVPLIRQMKSQQTRCMIAHMNSLATYFGIPMQGDYTAAKAAARIFLDTVRLELAHFGHKHIAIQTIHPGFVATEATADDGIPAPGEISAEAAAAYILKGFRSEKRENRFPFGTTLAVRIGRLAPNWLRSKILLSEAARDY